MSMRHNIKADPVVGHLAQLVGYTIRRVVVSPPTLGEREEWYGLEVEHGATGLKRTVWISSDPEGNGPGWLDILPARGEAVLRSGGES